MIEERKILIRRAEGDHNYDYALWPLVLKRGRFRQGIDLAVQMHFNNEKDHYEQCQEEVLKQAHFRKKV